MKFDLFSYELDKLFYDTTPLILSTNKKSYDMQMKKREQYENSKKLYDIYITMSNLPQLSVKKKPRTERQKLIAEVRRNSRKMKKAIDDATEVINNLDARIKHTDELYENKINLDLEQALKTNQEYKIKMKYISDDTRLANTIFDNLRMDNVNGTLIMFSNDKGDNKAFTVNERNFETISEIIRTKYTEGKLSADQLTEIGTTSINFSMTVDFWDYWDYITIIPNHERKYTKTKSNKGSFFKYTVNKFIHQQCWERYGLYTTINPDNYNTNCLFNAITNSIKLSKEKVLKLNEMLLAREIKMTLIKSIAEKLDISISVVTERKNRCNGTRMIKYNPGKKHSIKIGLIDDHYFPFDKETNISTFALKNFKDVMLLPNYNRIVAKGKNGYQRSNKECFISSFNLIRTLLENKHIYLSTVSLSTPGLMKTKFYKKAKNNIEFLDYDKKLHTRQYKFNSNNTFTKSRLVCADFETIITNGVHIPYMVALSYYNILGKITTNSYFNDNRTNYKDMKFIGNFVRELKDGDLVLFHNLNYDWRIFLKYFEEFIVVKTILNDGLSKTFQVKLTLKSGNRKSINVVFRDSLPMITMRLADFSKAFGIEESKEVMNYKAYTPESIITRDYNIEEYSKDFTPEEKKQFLFNIHNIKRGQKGTLINGDNFNHIYYARHYCEMDTIVLLKGYTTFRSWMLKICEDMKIKPIDIKNVISIGSLAKQIFSISGCFNDCYELSGHVQQFIQNTVVGGRCMTAYNKAYHIKQKEEKNKRSFLNDLDGVSLYPSSMSRINGFIKGTPIVIPDNNCNLTFLNSPQVTHYFVQVEIFNIPKKLAFPCISFINKEGVRMFDSDFRGTTYLDKVALEDAINFHKLVEGEDFKITRGYYFDQGYNNKINEVIRFLFNERLVKKKEGNPIQNIYKLIMNASYGKLIEKAKPISTKIFTKKKDYNVYVERNHNSIAEITVVNLHKPTGDKKIDNAGHKKEKYVVKVHSPINDHFNQSHNGSYVLSMSKRIMNEVQQTAFDLGINIFYQDTDSLHINTGVNNCNINKLADEYKKLYNRELLGSQLGQFHCDFDVKCNRNDPKSIEAYFLGKKMYAHNVEHYIKENNEEKVAHKIFARMKGIPAYCLQNVSSIKSFASVKEKKEGNKRVTKNKLFFNDTLEVFKFLATGKSINIDISTIAKSKNKALFKNCRNYDIDNKTDMNRTVTCYEEVIDVLI